MTNAEIRAVQYDLTSLIKGAVLDSGDLGYTNTVTIDNSRVTHEPRLVVVPSSSEDVAAVLKYLNKRGIPLTTKSGGHSATGYCLNAEGIVLDMLNLNSIKSMAGGEQLSLGAGTRWIKAYN